MATYLTSTLFYLYDNYYSSTLTPQFSLDTLKDHISFAVEARLISSGPGRQNANKIRKY